MTSTTILFAGESKIKAGRWAMPSARCAIPCTAQYPVRGQADKRMLAMSEAFFRCIWEVARPAASKTLDRLGHFTQLEFLNLASAGLRNFRENQVPRAFVGGQVLTAPLHQLVGACRCPRLQLDEGAGRLAPLVVGFRNHRGGGNGGMRLGGIFLLRPGNSPVVWKSYGRGTIP